MASRRVDSVDIPVTVAGHPALELCNTRAGWGEREPKEYLLTYRHLVVVVRELGLLDRHRSRALLEAAAADPVEAEQVLRRVRSFRSRLYSVLTEPAPSAADLDGVARELRKAGAGLTLEPRQGRLVVGQRPEGLDLPLRLLADEARRLLESEALDEVGRCPGTGCGWLFLREGRSRRWCIMALCGNREKARRYAARRRAATG